MCRSLKSCKWEKNACNALTQCSSPPSLSHLTASAHVLSSKDKGEKNLCSLPTGLPGWCVGDFSSKRKAATPPFARDPYQGLPAVFSTPPSRRRGNPPSHPRLRRVWGTDSGVFTSRCHDAGGGEEGRGRVGTREDRDPSALASSGGWAKSAVEV